jgi:hypothetical protein
MKGALLHPPDCARPRQRVRIQLPVPYTINLCSELMFLMLRAIDTVSRRRNQRRPQADGVLATNSHPEEVETSEKMVLPE